MNYRYARIRFSVTSCVSPSFEGIARREELLGAIELGLEIKFGAESLTLMPEISQIENLEQLRAIKEGIKTVSNLQEFQQIFRKINE